MQKAERIIFKTALRTLAVLVLVTMLAFCVLSIAWPGAMAKAFGQMGADGIASRYAMLSYQHTGKGSDLMAATEYAIFSENDRLIIEAGDVFIEHESFEDFCKSESTPSFQYREYVYRRLAVARYRLGRGDDALALAFGEEEAPLFLPAVFQSLATDCMDRGDKATCRALLDRLEECEIPADAEPMILDIKKLLNKEITNE